MEVQFNWASARSVWIPCFSGFLLRNFWSKIIWNHGRTILHDVARANIGWVDWSRYNPGMKTSRNHHGKGSVGRFCFMKQVDRDMQEHAFWILFGCFGTLWIPRIFVGYFTEDSKDLDVEIISASFQRKNRVPDTWTIWTSQHIWLDAGSPSRCWEPFQQATHRLVSASRKIQDLHKKKMRLPKPKQKVDRKWWKQP